jgi:hypothetical protein
MWHAAKKRAKEKGLEFDIELSDISIPEVCPILGTALQRERGSLTTTGCSPSLDRKDNSLGYVKGNVWVISHRANRLKPDATIEELEALLEFLKGTTPDASPDSPSK